MSGAPPLAWQVEETELNAWPALKEIYLDGWIVRLGGGVSRRANSASPLSLDARGGDALIAACENHYRRHKLPTLFRMVSLLDREFDDRLAARGYTARARPSPSTATSPRRRRRPTRKLRC